MTRDDIIRIAREAGFVTDEADFIYPPKTTRRGIGLEIERVIVLAVAAEREACAKVAENTYDRQIVWYPKGHYIDPNNLGDINKAVAEGCATAIRARGET